jgi:excisionase family DNA binding protein
VPAATRGKPTSTGWLDYHGAAERLGVTERFIKRIRERGDIPYYKFGKLVRFRIEDIETYAESNRVPHRVPAKTRYADGR